MKKTKCGCNQQYFGPCMDGVGLEQEVRGRIWAACPWAPVASDALLQLTHILSCRVQFLHYGFLPSCRARPTHVKVKKEVHDIHRHRGYCMLNSFFLHQECVNESLNLCYGTKWAQLLPPQKALACRDGSSLGKKKPTQKANNSVLWTSNFFFYTIFYFSYFIYLLLEGCAVCAMVMEAVYTTELGKTMAKVPVNPRRLSICQIFEETWRRLLS